MGTQADRTLEQLRDRRWLVGREEDGAYVVYRSGRGRTDWKQNQVSLAFQDLEDEGANFGAIGGLEFDR